MPLVPGRTFALSIPGGEHAHHDRSAGPAGRITLRPSWMRDGDRGNRAGGHTVGRPGAPHDPYPGVEGWQDGNYFYNKVRLEDVGGPRGIKKMGTEHVAAIGFFTRGMLIDIAALKGVTRLQKGYAITLADYQAALKAQGITDATQGDVVLLRTGWNSLWKDYTSHRTNRRRIMRSSPPGSPAPVRNSATIWPDARSP